jgi:chromosome segregation ATPase
MQSVTAPTLLRRVAVVCMLFLGLAGSHAADDKDKKAARAQQDRIAKMQQVQQALQQEKTQLSTERDELQAKLKKVQAQASKLGQTLKQEAELRTQVQALQGEKAALSESLKSTETELTALRSQQQNTLGQLAATQSTLANTRTAYEGTQQTLMQRDKSLAFCQDQNRAFYDINRKLLQRFESTAAAMTPWYALPLQFDRVALENEGLVIRDQIEERKLPMESKAQ